MIIPYAKMKRYIFYHIIIIIIIIIIITGTITILCKKDLGRNSPLHFSNNRT